MIAEILMLFVFVPGLAELLVVLTIFLVLKSRNSSPWYVVLNRAILFMAIFGLVVWSLINISWGNAPLKPLQYALIGAWAYHASTQKNPLSLKLSFPVAIVIFSVFLWQFTFARTEMKTEVLCEGVKTPVTASLSYHYGKLAGFHFSEVNGKKWNLGDEWPKCDQPENMPQHSMAIRGLTFSHM